MSEHVTMAEHYNDSENRSLSMHYARDTADVLRIMVSELSTEIHFTDGSVFRIAYGLIGGSKGEGIITTYAPVERKGVNV